MKLIYSFLLIALITACTEEEKKPDYLWEQDRFVEVLTEVQLAESYVRIGYHRSEDSILISDSVYSAVFRKMQTDRPTFDSNYNYYLNRPKEMEKVYEEVITNLNQRSAGIK